MAESEDRELDTLLADHAEVRAAYRSASIGDVPAAALDAAILAASRKAVKACPERVDRPARFMRRLAMPLSAAAVMVLATSLSFLVYEERGAPSSPASSPASYPTSSPTVPAPTPAAATADNADRSVAREVPSAPTEVAVDSPRAKSISEVRATTRPSPVPMSATTEAAGSAPEAPIPAAPSSPASTAAAMPKVPVAARQSDVSADAQGARAPIPRVSEAQESASATRAAEAVSERAAAEDDRREALRQAEAARAMAPSRPVAGLVTQTRRAEEATAGTAGVDGAPESAASMAVEAPVGLAAKRFASPVRERAIDSASRDAGSSMAVPGAEETPAEWIVRVRALVDGGRIGVARAEIARLRCRYPDVTLPPDLPAPEAGVACPSAAAKEGSPDLR